MTIEPNDLTGALTLFGGERRQAMTLRLTAAWRGGYEGRPGWWLTFRPSEGFQEQVNRLKATVPPGERTYREEDHAWWVSDAWVGELTALIPTLESHLNQPALPGLGG